MEQIILFGNHTLTLIGRAFVHLWVLLLYGTNTPPNFAPTPSPLPAVISNLFSNASLSATNKLRKPAVTTKPSGKGSKASSKSKMNSISSKNSKSDKVSSEKFSKTVVITKNELKKMKKPNRNNKNRTGTRKSLTVYVPKTARPGGFISRGGSQTEEDVGLIYLAPFPDSPVHGNVLFKKYPRVEQLFELPNYSNFDLLEASLQLEAAAGKVSSLPHGKDSSSRQSKKGAEDVSPRSKGIQVFAVY